MWRAYFGKLEDGRYWGVFRNSIVYMWYEHGPGARRRKFIRSFGTVYEVVRDRVKLYSLPRAVREWVRKNVPVVDRVVERCSVDKRLCVSVAVLGLFVKNVCRRCLYSIAERYGRFLMRVAEVLGVDGEDVYPVEVPSLVLDEAMKVMYEVCEECGDLFSVVE